MSIKPEEDKNRDNDPKEITSETKFKAEELNHHFRIYAGPGAGKTYWLVEHIKNVLKNSKRLTPTLKIACITYTNIAAEEIKSRLEISDDVVEVSTIHSFLYKNIVKPYAFLLKDENGDPLIDVEKLDGHDKHKPSFGKIKKWVDNEPKMKRTKYLQLQDKNLMDCVNSFRWCLKSNDSCLPEFKDFYGIHKHLHDKGKEYKLLYWKEGTIHHEDVLYLSNRILNENPALSEFIAAKFPYVFLDEFQDTNPIQTKIVESFAEKGTVVGIIGDSSQSIFQFNGAKREDFINFNLPGQIDYLIKGNRRSSKKIIKFLNHLRKNASDGIQQRQVNRNYDGEKVCMVVSNDLCKVVTFFDNQTIDTKSRCILARDNKEVSNLKRQNNTDKKNLWDELIAIDRDRTRFLNSILSAAEYANQKRYDMAVKEIIKTIRTNEKGEIKEPFRGSNQKLFSKFEKRSIAVSILECLVNEREKISNQTIFDFYNELSSLLSNIIQFELKKIRESKFKKIADYENIEDLINSLNILDDKTEIRTVHKAKGAEFEAVLLYLNNSEELNYILQPDLEHEEDEHRIRYVALSRAKDKLFISVPSIEEEEMQQIKDLGIDIIFLDNIKND